MGWDRITTPEFWLTMLVLVLSIGLHEYGHAKFADLAGDPTPRMMGRVTLNPLKHLDPVGTILMVITTLSGVGIGWGKPVMVHPERMRNPRWDHLVSVAAGPVMNALLAFLFALMFRMGHFNIGDFIGENGLELPPGAMAVQILGLFSLIGLLVNVGLMLFNLIPIGPLDGHWILGAFLPDRQRNQWYQFNRGIGALIFLAIIFIPGQFNPLKQLLGPAIFRISFFLLGHPSA